MSAAPRETTLKSKLEALQCHFTWDLDSNESCILRFREKLEDIGTGEGNSWLGHIYNLQGFISYQLRSTDEAKSFFKKAAEAFHQIRKMDEGPWLVVNYGNQAWLHYHQGEEAESLACLSKVNDLMIKYPTPSQKELHAEIYAEKAWTLMNITKGNKLLAVDYYEKAIKMQPDMVEWKTSYVLVLLSTLRDNSNKLEDDILKKMRKAKEEDPENLYLPAQYLRYLGYKKEIYEDEARELATKIVRNPVSSYNGMSVLLHVYKLYGWVDEGIALVEEALKNHPDERYLKRCATTIYKWKILSDKQSRPQQREINRAVQLHKEVIDLYPHSSFVKRIELANIYAKYNDGLKAQQIYNKLFEHDLVPADKQVLYNMYAKYLFFGLKDADSSIEYHMKAAEIPHKSFFRVNSIKNLKKIRDRGNHPMCSEIDKCLTNLDQL